MSIKVLVFGMTDNPGGMESCVMNYYRNIDWSDVQFDFLCNWENMVYADEVTAKGSKIYTIPQKSKDYKAYKKALDDFFKAHKGEYDVFWYNTCTLTNIDYLVYAKKYGIKKRIIHAHNSGNETSKLRGIFHYLNKTRLSQYATDYWSCSMAASEYFYNENIINSPKHHIINNAIQTKDYAFNEAVRNEIRKEYKLEDKYVIGHVGRFQYQKNHEFLVDVFNEYLKLDNNVVLMLIGQGEGEEAIRQKVADLGMTENVMFMGVRSDVNKLLQAMDIFVLPSHFEGLPLVLVEAQTAGLPCYASKDVITKESDVTGNIELRSQYRNAIICEMNDKRSCIVRDNLEIRLPLYPHFPGRSGKRHPITKNGIRVHPHVATVAEHQREFRLPRYPYRVPHGFLHGTRIRCVS